MTLPVCLEQQKALLVRKFNQRSREGINDLKRICANNSLDPNSSIAQFFIAAKPTINLTSVGNYLGGMEENSEAILEHFLEGIDFSKMAFTDALRRYFQHFHLPGEAYKVDRVLRKFGDFYLRSNPNSSIRDADAAYVLALQALMLNAERKTSLMAINII